MRENINIQKSSATLKEDLSIVCRGLLKHAVLTMDRNDRNIVTMRQYFQRWERRQRGDLHSQRQMNGLTIF